MMLLLGWRPGFSVRALAAAAALLAASGTAGSAQTPDGPSAKPLDAAFEAIASSYFSDGFRESPSNATVAGYHKYDLLLDDVHPRAYAAHFKREHDALRALAAIDPSKLSTETAVDRTMLMRSIDEDLLISETREQWRHNPGGYVDIVSGAVYGPVSRDYAPLNVRMSQVISRERGIPALLGQAERNVTTVDASTKQDAVENAEGAVDLFATTLPLAFEPVQDQGLRRSFGRTNTAAIAAVASYAVWVKSIKPSGSFALGQAAYAKLLLDEDSVDTPIPRLLEIAQAALRRTHADYVATAKRIDPSKTPAQVYDEITKVHPEGAALLAAAQTDLVALRAFVIAKRIVTLPPNSDIVVTETPSFQRAVVEAGMDVPGPLETVATRAYYYVTPPDPAWSKRQTDGYLKLFSDSERPIVSAHEVYPGHYVNFMVAKQLPLSLTRKLLGSGSYKEGWAHYDEQMVVDEGWGNGDPRVRLAQLEMALLRNCRFVAGIELHTAGWSQERAEDMFVRQCFQPSAIAQVEALRGTQDPLYGRYTMGKMMILKLRADYKAKVGSGYTLQRFHDAFLAHGDPPIPLLRTLMLGGADDGKPL